MLDMCRWLFAALAIFLTVRDAMDGDYKYRKLIISLCICVFLLSIKVTIS